ncbi:MAG: hypothetical protein LBQ60_16105 [Bacteroidales bacterium]|nr:hypothetical protein [Bacteroidales bacterium]
MAVNERNFYKYGRKELQTEMSLNWGDHENRMSDYTTGRWWVVDPLAEDYYGWSPYNYCFNNPLLFVDPDGRGPFNKLPFNGSAWDYLKSIPNFATNLVNGLIDGAVGLIKGGAATASVIYHEGLSGYGSALASEAKGMANGVAQFVEGEINYHSTTPIGEQFKNAFSPQSIETALTIAVPVITGTAVANLTKGAATNVAKGTAKNTVAETTSAAKTSSRVYEVGTYKSLRGVEVGLDAHHVGQKALMSKFIPGYNPSTAPSILVPKLGHTQGIGVLSRETSGLSNARQILARDIFELRRVYPNVPNTSLQQLIQINKSMYPSAFVK